MRGFGNSSLFNGVSCRFLRAAREHIAYQAQLVEERWRNLGQKAKMISPRPPQQLATEPFLQTLIQWSFQYITLDPCFAAKVEDQDTHCLREAQGWGCMSISVPFWSFSFTPRICTKSKCELEKVLVWAWRDFSPIVILLALDWSVNILLKPAFFWKT